MNPLTLLRPSGVSQGLTVLGAPVPEPKKLTYSKLSELTGDYQFYTPALVHLSTAFFSDPFDVYCEEQNILPNRYIVNLPNPILFGLTDPNGNPGWNFRLHALAKPDWEGFCSWFGSCCYNDSKRGLLRRIRTQNLFVSDPLDKGNSRIPIVAFVVESNKGSFYFVPAGEPGQFTSHFDANMVYMDTELMAKALQNTHPDPYRFVEENIEVPDDTEN